MILSLGCVDHRFLQRVCFVLRPACAFRVLERTRRMREKNGYECIETRRIKWKDQTSIRFYFLEGGADIPSSTTVKVGDIDTLTGEVITKEWIETYLKFADDQVRTNLRYEQPQFTDREQAVRRKKKEAFKNEFLERWGYLPSEDDVADYMKEKVDGERMNLHIEALVDENGENIGPNMLRQLRITPVCPEDIPTDIQALRDVAATLTDREAEVYDVMADWAAGSGERLRFKDLAQEWGVSPARVNALHKKVKEKIIDHVDELNKANEW